MKVAPIKEETSVDVFEKIDIRVGTIESIDDVEGAQALFVVNLLPRKMKGILSEGMLFDIGYADGILPVLATPENKAPVGTRAG